VDDDTIATQLGTGNKSNAAWYEVEKNTQTQINWVNGENYLPEWRNYLEYEGKKRIVSFGHDVLYYYKGLLETIDEKDLRFLRIRRPRDEVARSMIQDDVNGNEHLEGTNTTAWLLHWWFLSPMHNGQNIVMKMEPEVWSGLTQFQKGLWFVDEVEARWQQLRADHPSLRTSCFWWSKYVPDPEEGSFDAMAAKVASMLGLALSKDLADSKQHTTTLYGSDYDHFQAWAQEQDESYRDVAGYEDWQKELVQEVQWGMRPEPGCGSIGISFSSIVESAAIDTGTWQPSLMLVGAVGGVVLYLGVVIGMKQHQRSVYDGVGTKQNSASVAADTRTDTRTPTAATLVATPPTLL
jgi:hypothetical protein